MEDCQSNNTTKEKKVMTYIYITIEDNVLNFTPSLADTEWQQSPD